ncbi:dihydrolipoyl dehydrogenase [Paracoccaceae bacterium]|nr:dihydrolipoyl dehydrogenase [Paracoccaceae bacterium]
MDKFDAIVIGSGPGGYVCAIKLAQLGIKVACVEGKASLGGTCLNVGCIPSKALLNASHNYHNSIENFSKMGIEVERPSVNWGKMLNYKDTMIVDNTKGIEYLFKKNKITLINGWASFVDNNTIRVSGKNFGADHIVIASGSEATSLNDIKFDEQVIVSSTGALELKKIPEKMVVVGAGVIGLEMGSIYSRLGTEITILEFYDKVLNGMDHDISKNFKSILQRQGFKFHLSSSVSTITKEKQGVKVTYEKKDSNSPNELFADVVLVATGRKPFTQNLKLENIGVNVNSKGQIETDSNWRTTTKNIFAIGDVTPGPMLAHKAEEEGIAVAEIIAGQAGHVNFEVIPSVVYTDPEVASVGKTENELREEGIEIKVGKFSFMGNGRAKTVFSNSGFVKVIAEYNSDRILGAHIIGPAAGDLIHEICVAMEFGASTEDLARTCHAHPTFSEAVREAALACGVGAIHS